MRFHKEIKYYISLLIVFSATFHYGAYALAVVGFAALLLKKPQHILDNLRNEKAFYFIAAAMVLSTGFSRALQSSLMLDGVLLMLAMVFFMLSAYIDKENIDSIFVVLNTLGIIICLYGVYQYFTGDLTINKSWTDQRTFGSLVRIYSTLRNPNIFAGYLTFNLSFAVAYFSKNRADIYASINIMLSTLCLILTYSRGGFIAFIAAMLVVTILSKDIKVGAYLVVVTMMYYSYNTIGTLDRASLGMLSSDSSSLYRMEIWKESIKLFYHNILLGSGLGSVMKYLSYSSDKLIGFIAHSHNIYLHVLAETGILGFLAFCYLAFTNAKKAVIFFFKYKDNEHIYICIGFLACLAAFFVHGLVDCVAFVPTRSMIFWIYLCLFPILYKKLNTRSTILD